MHVRMSVSLVVAVLLLVPAVALAEDKDQLDPAKLVGNWTFVSGEKGGQKSDPEMLKKNSIVITKDKLTLKTEQGDFVMKYTIDTKKNPAAITLEIVEAPLGVGTKSNGIVALKGDELKLCYAAMGGDTPKEFSAKKDGEHYFVLTRKK